MNSIDLLEDLMFLELVSQNCRQGVKILIETNPDLFYKTIRMTCAQFEGLLNLIEPWLRKFSKRRSIEPQHRLLFTLEYLAHGSSLHVLSMKFRIGLETAKQIILETSYVLWKVLSTLYISPPEESQWKDIAEENWRKCRLPNCV